MSTIIIGVGGVGKVVLMQLRRMIVEEEGRLDARINFLHVDTYSINEQEVGQIYTTHVLGQDIKFKDRERCIMSNSLTRENIKLYLQQKCISEWLPQDLSPDIDYSTGAGGIRPCGRLAFYVGAWDFRNKLITLIPQLGSGTNVNVNVYVVCSFFGGTGGGSFLDICYLTRHVVRECNCQPQMHGLFVIGTQSLENSRMIANCYAALMELEYYMTGTNQFKAEYPQIGDVESSEGPVDICYLFGATSQGGLHPPRRYDREEIESMIARRLFFESRSTIRGTIDAQRVDMIGDNTFERLDSELGRPKKFFGTGCSTVEFPVPRLTNFLASLLAKHCYGILIGDNVQLQNINSRLDIFFREELFNGPLTKDTLFNKLSDSSPEINKLCVSYQESLSEYATKDAAKIYDQALNIFEEAKQKCDIQLKGEFAAKCNEQKDILVAKLLDNFGEICLRHINNIHFGPTKLIEFLDGASQRIQNMLKQAQVEEESFTAIHQKFEDKVVRRLRRISDDKNYKWELSKHLGWFCHRELNSFIRTSIRKTKYGFVIEILSKIKNAIRKEAERTRALIDFLRSNTELYAARADEQKRDIESWIGKEEAHIGAVHLKLLKEMLTRYNQLGIAGFIDQLSQIYSNNNLASGQGKSLANGILTRFRNIYEVFPQNTGTNNDSVFNECRTALKNLLVFNICDILTAIVDTRQVSNMLNEKMRLSEWPLPLSLIGRYLQHNPSLHQKKWIGVNSNTATDHVIWNRFFSQYVPNLRFQTFEEEYRIVFISEVTVFCLRDILSLKEFKKIYEKEENAIRRQRHINNDHFKDLYS